MRFYHLRSALLVATMALMVPDIAIHTAIAAAPSDHSSDVMKTFESPLAELDFPLLVALQQDPIWAKALRQDKRLIVLAKERADRLSTAKSCTTLPSCRIAPWLWNEKDMATIGQVLSDLATKPNFAASLISRTLRPSRHFALHENLDDARFIAAAWEDTAKGMNYVMRVYAGGEAPRYPLIDSTIFDTKQPDYAALLTAQDAVTVAQNRPDDLIFNPALRYATTLLITNERDDALYHRPLLSGPNAPTVATVKALDWHAYRYSAILLFGHGPEDPISRTGVMGHLRLRLAADRFYRGVAPVIILSGGAVHPNRTRFNEAIEMREELIRHYGVPADRILIEPHARHTTTNLRNIARLMFMVGFPEDKDALILSTPETIRYIGSTELAERNKRELGYLPGKIGAGPDPLSLTFRPDTVSFHIDPMDPLDP